MVFSFRMRVLHFFCGEQKDVCIRQCCCIKRIFRNQQQLIPPIDCTGTQHGFAVLLQRDICSGSSQAFTKSRCIAKQGIVCFADRKRHVRQSGIGKDFCLTGNKCFQIIPEIRIEKRFQRRVDAEQIVALQRCGHLCGTFRFRGRTGQPIQNRGRRVHKYAKRGKKSQCQNQSDEFSFHRQTSFIYCMVVQMKNLLRKIRQLSKRSTILYAK